MSVGAIAFEMVRCALGVVVGIALGNLSIHYVGKIRSPPARLALYLLLFFACIFALAIVANSHKENTHGSRQAEAD